MALYMLPLEAMEHMSEEESIALERYRMTERWRARAARLAAKRWRQYVAGVKSIEPWATSERDALVARREMWAAEAALERIWKGVTR